MEHLDVQTHPPARSRTVLWVGLALAASYWLLESVLHVYVFRQGELGPQLFTIDPHEVWKRSLVVALLVGFSFFAQHGLEQRRRIERRLRSAHAELNQIFQTASVAMRLIDRERRVVKVNQTFVDLSGVGADAAVGTTCHEVFSGELCHGPDCPLRRIEAGEAEVDCEVEKQRRDGTKVPCLLTARPFRDEAGELVGIVESFKDVTEARAARAAAARSEQLAALGELAAGVAHEINNPINGILNYGQMLLSRQRDPATVREVAEQIVREGGRVADIVSSLLAFSRREPRSCRLTDLGEVLADTLTLAGSQLRQDGIEVVVEAPAGLPPVACVAQEVQQVFVNLLSNARYALRARRDDGSGDGLRLAISLAPVEADGRPFLRVRFEDNGIGIPREILDKVTLPFFSNKPPRQGTGLGLSISHGIVSAHGGRLGIDSVEGEHTRVDVLLPVGAGDGTGAPIGPGAER